MDLNLQRRIPLPRVVIINPTRLQAVSLISQSLTRALLAVIGIPMRQTNSYYDLDIHHADTVIIYPSKSDLWVTKLFSLEL